MAQVSWSRRAIADLEAIRSFIAADRPLAGHRMAQRLQAAANSLAEFPERGRQSGARVRELAVIYPYIIRYTVKAEGVFIVRIKHGAQRPES